MEQTVKPSAARETWSAAKIEFPALEEYRQRLTRERLLADALARENFGAGSDGITRTLKLAYEFGEQHPEILDRVPHLHVFRNIFAAVPWPAAALNGPHDLLWPTEEEASR